MAYICILNNKMQPAKKPDELLIQDLIIRILKGESSLYEKIVRIYDRYLYKIGLSYGFDHQATEDLMQDTFVNAFIHLKDFENRSSFHTWITKIMIHECYHKKYRSKFRKEIYLNNDGNDDRAVFISPPVKPDKFVSNNELKYNLEKAISQIPEDYRIVFTLRQLNGLSVQETAAVLNISESNVKVRLNRAKAMLRSEIEKTYSLDELFEFNLIYCDALVNRVMNTINSLEKKQQKS